MFRFTIRDGQPLLKCGIILLCLFIAIAAIAAGPVAGYVAIEMYPTTNNSDDSPFGEALGMLRTGVGALAVAWCISAVIGTGLIGAIVQEFLQD